MEAEDSGAGSRRWRRRRVRYADGLVWMGWAWSAFILLLFLVVLSVLLLAVFVLVSVALFCMQSCAEKSSAIYLG